MKNFIPVLLIIVVLISALFIFRTYSESKNGSNDHSDFHMHAAFHVYKNNEKIDFSASQYMYFKQCGVEEQKEMTVKDKIHLHDGNGEVAHIHTEGVIWRDLFESLEHDFSEDPLPVMFVNGMIDPYLLDKEINNYDIAIFVFGPTENLDALRENLPTVEDIKKVESISESC